jgi:hypothetical protein
VGIEVNGGAYAEAVRINDQLRCGGRWGLLGLQVLGGASSGKMDVGRSPIERRERRKREKVFRGFIVAASERHTTCCHWSKAGRTT